MMMTRIYLIAIALLTAISCKAQFVQETKPLYSNDNWREIAQENTYYKDFNNDLGRLVGTWKVTSSLETFELSLVSNEKYLTTSYTNAEYEEDMLYGE